MHIVVAFAGANVTWFHLYRCVLAAAAPTAAAEAVTPAAVATLLEQYMQTSTLGQYNARLQLLQGVQGHLMALDTPSAPALAAVVYHVARFYAQFLGAVQDALEVDLKALRQHLKVIAMWRCWFCVFVFHRWKLPQKGVFHKYTSLPSLVYARERSLCTLVSLVKRSFKVLIVIITIRIILIITGLRQACYLGRPQFCIHACVHRQGPAPAPPSDQKGNCCTRRARSRGAGWGCPEAWF